MGEESTRRQLFQLEDRVEIRNRERWNQAWIYIDNFWRMDSNNQNELIYCCTLNRPRKSKKNQNGMLWKPMNCPAKMKVVLEGDVGFVFTSQFSSARKTAVKHK
jgi:hypothetical protein